MINYPPKIIFVIGTRPEVIKIAPVFHLLKKSKFKTKMLVTGQHRTMLDQTLQIFDLEPDYNLNIMQPNQRLSDLTALVLKQVMQILLEEKPDMVLVQGDTTTTMAASLAAFYNHITIGHIEAGLRTWDKYAPFPEELNRQITDRLSDLHFAPTIRNKNNLLSESIPETSVFLTGNTTIDALFWMKNRLQQKTLKFNEIPFNICKKKYLLVTAHRRESFGRSILSICKALRKIAYYKPNLPIIYPVHKNPNIHDVVYKELNGVPNIYLLPPLGYDRFVYLMIHSWIILTDSGGIQEEAPSLGIPVLVLRDKTERQEAVEAGTVKLVGTETSNIVCMTQLLIENEKEYSKMSFSSNPYGDGRASEKIYRILKQYLSY